MGDGNLSNPNGRAVRLRITCDSKYPHLISKIEKSLKILAPTNKVSRVYRKNDNAIDISCYSNDWEKVLGWKANAGSKIKQKISVPSWILSNKHFSRLCLCGLFETDGSIYMDRTYKTVNFVTQIPTIATSVKEMLDKFSFQYSCQQFPLSSRMSKYTFRIHKNATEFISYFNLEKY